MKQLRSILHLGRRRHANLHKHSLTRVARIRIGLTLLVGLTMVAVGIAVANPTASRTSGQENADTAADVFGSSIDDLLVTPGPEASPPSGNEALPAPAPSINASLKQAIEEEIGVYAGCVSVCYVPLEGSSDTVPSELNAPKASEALGIDATQRRTAASMIKLIILSELLNDVAQGTHSLSEQMVVSAGDIVGGSGVVQSMGPGTVLSLEDAARYMIADSDNVATNMLINLLGEDAINARAAHLGLKETELQRTMLDVAAEAQGRENYTSARDLATLLCAVAQGSFVNPSMSSLALEFLKQQSDRNGIVDGVPSDIVVAHKTGTLSDVEHDGGIVLARNPYVLVIMTEGIDNAQAKTLMGAISHIVYEHV